MQESSFPLKIVLGGNKTALGISFSTSTLGILWRCPQIILGKKPYIPKTITRTGEQVTLARG